MKPILNAKKFSLIKLASLITLIATLSACGQGDQENAQANHDEMQDHGEKMQMSEVFLKAEPAVDEVLARPTRTLRLYFNALPDVPTSAVKLFGEQGEISLSGFHTMGADDLMIEIDDHPLPNGKYKVEWMAMLGEEKAHHMGSYEFTVAAE